MIRGDYRLLKYFPPWRRKPMSPEQVMKVLVNVRPGFLAPAYLMKRVSKRGIKWVLRVRLKHPAGYHAVTLPAEMVQMVRQAVAKNRAEWEVYRHSEEWKEQRRTNLRQRDLQRAAVYHRLVEEQEREERNRDAV